MVRWEEDGAERRVSARQGAKKPNLSARIDWAADEAEDPERSEAWRGEPTAVPADVGPAERSTLIVSPPISAFLRALAERRAKEDGRAPSVDMDHLAY